MPMPMHKQIAVPSRPFSVASSIGGNVLMSSDKTYFLAPDSARSLGQQLQTSADNAESITPNELMIPFTAQEKADLYAHKRAYEKQHQTKFSDLGAFVSHIVARQLQGV